MSGGKRLAMAIWVAGLAFGHVAAFGQSTDAQTNSPPPPDSVGPRELQNFSLSGNVTKPVSAPAPSTAAPNSPTAVATEPASTAAQSLNDRGSAPVRSLERAKQTQVVSRAEKPGLPPQRLTSPAEPRSAPVPVAAPATAPVTAGTSAVFPPRTSGSPLTDSHPLLLWPWLLALCVLASGLALLFWRNRQRHAFPGGLEFEPYGVPEPAPAPPAPPRVAQPVEVPSALEFQPAPATAPPRIGARGGIVSSRLRPWIDVGIQPLRCIVEDHQIAVEFELELFNSGNAPARAVLVEASIFNAGPAQDEEIRAFMDRPVGAGERLEAIPPLQRVDLRTQVVAPRASVQIFELADRQLFVPLIAFNALYRWSGGEGQTSVSYLLGRDTKSDKLAPFRLDLGRRVFRGLGARPLPLETRR